MRRFGPSQGIWAEKMGKTALKDRNGWAWNIHHRSKKPKKGLFKSKNASKFFSVHFITSFPRKGRKRPLFWGCFFCFFC